MRLNFGVAKTLAPGPAEGHGAAHVGLPCRPSAERAVAADAGVGEDGKDVDVVVVSVHHRMKDRRVGSRHDQRIES